jgi:hypothetical protein
MIKSHFVQIFTNSTEKTPAMLALRRIHESNDLVTESIR